MKIAGLEMDIPDTWEDRSLYTFVAPAQEMRAGMTTQTQSFRTNVVVTRKPQAEGRTLDDIGTELVERTKRDFGDVKVEVSDGPKAAGADTKRGHYTVVDPRGGAPVAQVQYVFFRDNYEWVVTFSVAALELKKEMPTFDRMVAAMRPA